MSDVKSGKTKFAQAMQDAAMGSVSEDINNICNSIEKIIHELPELAKQQVASLKEEIESLGAGLKAVPEQFDLDFARKMNRILDVALEIDNHSKQLRLDIRHHNQQLSLDLNAHSKQFISTLETNTANKIINDVTGHINKQIDGLHTMSISNLICFGMTSAVIGGAMTGMLCLLYLKSLV